MKVLICNNDIEKAEECKSLVNAFSEKNGIELSCRIFLNSVEAAAVNERFEIAIIEMDTEEINGKALGSILKLKMPYVKLIFTSSHIKDIDASFDVQAVRFLKRPYSKARFFAGLKEALRRLEEETVFFDLSDGDEKIMINKNSIEYIEIENRKTKVFTQGKTYYSNNSIHFWKEHLHSSKFISPHKSYLINVEYIEKYKRNNYIIMKNGARISVARAKSQAFNNSFNAYKNLML